MKKNVRPQGYFDPSRVSTMKVFAKTLTIFA